MLCLTALAVLLSLAAAAADWKQPQPFKVTDATRKELVSQESGSNYSPGNATFGFSAAIVGSAWSGYETQKIALVCSPGSADLGFDKNLKTVFNAKMNSDPGYCELFDLSGQFPTKKLIPKKPSYIGPNDNLVIQQLRSKFGASASLAPPETPERHWQSYGKYDALIGNPNLATCEEVSEDQLNNDFNGTLGVENWGLQYSRQLETKELTSPPVTVTETEIEHFQKQCAISVISEYVQQGDTLVAVKKSISDIYTTRRNLFGFSSHVSEDKDYKAIGAPMFRYGLGNVKILMKDDDNQYKDYQPQLEDAKHYIMCDYEYLKKHTSCGKAGCFAEFAGCQQDQSYGYTITSLVIDGKTYLAAGGPRANGLKGAVKVFRLKKLSGSVVDTLEVLSVIYGENFNSGFGTTLDSVDLDGDGQDELLVGEPYYQAASVGSFDAGRVSIYAYDSQLKKFVVRATVDSPDITKPGMFGFVVSTLKDIDADGCGDFAVSAMNMDGGKVYLYSGKQISSKYKFDSAIKIEPMQTLNQTGTRMFGYALSSADVDFNSYRDVIVTDVQEENPKAYFFYSQTLIKIVSFDEMKDSYVFEQKNWNCDLNQNTVGVDNNFCFEVLIKVDASPENLPGFFHLKDATLSQSFNFDLSLQVTGLIKAEDPVFKTVTDAKSVTVAPGSVQQVKFPIYGKIDQYAGETVKISALSTVSGAAPVLTRDFNGPVAFSQEDYKYVEISVGDIIDAQMFIEHADREVFLGQAEDEETFKVTIQRSSGGRFFLAGKLQVRFESSLMSLTLRKSAVKESGSDSTIASCQQSSTAVEVVECKFVDGKQMKGDSVDIYLTYDAKALVDGDKDASRISMKYNFEWNNRRDTVAAREKSGSLNLKYRSDMSHEALAPSVGVSTAFRNPSTVKHSITLRNAGPSKVGAYTAEFTLTQVAGVDATMGSDDCKKCGDGDDCTYICSNAGGLGSEGQQMSRLYVVEYTVKDEGAWSKVRKENIQLKTDFNWRVTDGAKYSASNIEQYPITRAGSGSVVTPIQQDKEDFPWWIVVITLLISIIIVSLVVVILYKKGFFKKRDVDKIVLDDIADEDIKENFDMDVKNSGV